MFSRAFERWLTDHLALKLMRIRCLYSKPDKVVCSVILVSGILRIWNTPGMGHARMRTSAFLGSPTLWKSALTERWPNSGESYLNKYKNMQVSSCGHLHWWLQSLWSRKSPLLRDFNLPRRGGARGSLKEGNTEGAASKSKWNHLFKITVLGHLGRRKASINQRWERK